MSLRSSLNKVRSSSFQYVEWEREMLVYPSVVDGESQSDGGGKDRE